MATIVNETSSLDNATDNMPGTVKAVLIMTGFKIVLAFTFFTVFSVTDLGSGLGDPMKILFTALGYVAMCIPIYLFTRKRNLVALRISLLIDLLISLPVVAVVGVVISAVGLGLSFGKKFKGYFGK